VTVLPVGADAPLNAGVVTFVILSEFEAPESVAAVMMGVPGAAGPLIVSACVADVGYAV
jgi:hypothetical protein